MSTDPYTPGQMDAPNAEANSHAASPQDARPASFDELHAEAKAALTYSANTLRAIRERFREAHAADVARWQQLYESSADRSEVGRLGEEVGDQQSQLAKMDLAIKNLESTWLFLERGDATLVSDAELPGNVADMQMRIVEAQEAERTRLAQEIHDGPGQALTNAIFQVEYVERIIVRDPREARAELRDLRDILRRELSDVRTFISALRPPVLDQLGLDGAIRDTIEHLRTLTGLPITAELSAPPERLGEAAQTVVLRIVQEALHNVRKHAAASTVTVSTEARDGEWTLEVRDDGQGFDVGAVAARGRRNFGLQFMRERAELIGASFDVRSRPDGGTVVRLMIPVGARGE